MNPCQPHLYNTPRYTHAAARNGFHAGTMSFHRSRTFFKITDSVQVNMGVHFQQNTYWGVLKPPIKMLWCPRCHVAISGHDKHVGAHVVNCLTGASERKEAQEEAKMSVLD